ncbi:MAG TPA: hypothetical protein VEI02_06615 [Planctomycetota bacterium]|nr:hypothetical protein [Planctomycetota bacterium]
MDRDSDMTATVVTDVARIRTGRNPAWGAILAGAAVTVCTHVALSFLGSGIGLGLLPSQAETTDDVPEKLAIGAAAWWLIATVAAVFAGAFVAGRLAEPFRRPIAALHGLSTWGASTFVWLAAMSLFVGGAAGGVYGVMTNALENANPNRGDDANGGGGLLAAALPGDAFDVRREVAGLDRGRFRDDAASTRPAFGADQGRRGAGGSDVEERLASFVGATVRGERAVAVAEREELTRALSESHGLSEAEARARVEAWEARVNRATARAKEVAKKAAKVASAAALWGFLGLALSAGAGCLGGVVGAKCSAKMNDKVLMPDVDDDVAPRV